MVQTILTYNVGYLFGHNVFENNFIIFEKKFYQFVWGHQVANENSDSFNTAIGNSETLTSSIHQVFTFKGSKVIYF